MGKSPLRLICQRTEVSSHSFREVLECGHFVHSSQDFAWDELGHMVWLPLTAKRRRCRRCKEEQTAQLFASPKKPVQSVSIEEEQKRRRRTGSEPHKPDRGEDAA